MNALQAFFKKRWDEAKVKLAAPSLHYYEEDGDRRFELTMTLSLTADDLPKEYIAARAEFRKVLRERAVVFSALQRLTRSSSRRELRTSILESVLRMTKKGQQLSALVDEMVKTARQHLLKA